MILNSEKTGIGTPGGPGLALAHGILGLGANLRTLGRRVSQARADFSTVVVDLRAHGGSQGHEGADTVAQAGLDVAQTLSALSPTTQALLGHSFGGKVMLAALEHLPGVRDVFLLDSNPGVRSERYRGSESTMEVLAQLDTLVGAQGEARWPKRADFIAAVEASGQSPGIAQWLAMSLVPIDTGFRFGLELPRIRALIESYFSTDLWPVVERTKARVHFTIGERSAVFAEQDRVRALALAQAEPSRVTVHLLPAGHWVHVDAFEPLLRVVLAEL